MGSRPAETISFSLPSGGFNGKKSQSKSKPLNMHVDELFNQYFPSQNEGQETEVSSKQKNRTTKVDQYSIGKQPKHCVEQILDNILSNVLYCSMKRTAKKRRELEKDDSSDQLLNDCDILISAEDFHHPNAARRKRRKTENLGLNGGYWGAVGVRGAVREKIKKQGILEKEDTKVKKKIKKWDSAVIKTHSITVENTLSRITPKSTTDK